MLIHIRILPCNDERLFVEINIFGQGFPGLADTGAMPTCISKDMAEHLHLQRVKPAKSSSEGRLTDGRQIRTNHTSNFCLSPGGAETTFHNCIDYKSSLCSYSGNGHN